MSQAEAIVRKIDELKEYITQGGEKLAEVLSIQQDTKEGPLKAVEQVSELIDKESGQIKDINGMRSGLNTLKTYIFKVVMTLTKYKDHLIRLGIAVPTELDEAIDNYKNALQTINDILSEAGKLQQQAQATQAQAQPQPQTSLPQSQTSPSQPKAPSTQAQPQTQASQSQVKPSQTQLPELPADEVAKHAISVKKAALLLRKIVDTIYNIISQYELPPDVDFQQLSDEEKNEYVRRRSVELYKLFWRNYNPRRGEILRNLQVLEKFLKKKFNPEEAPQFLREVYDRIQEAAPKIESYIREYNLVASAMDLSSAFDVLDGVTPEKIEAAGQALKVLEGLAGDIISYIGSVAKKAGVTIEGTQGAAGKIEALIEDLARRLAGIGKVSAANELSLIRLPGGIFLLSSDKERAEGWINAKIKQSKIAGKEKGKKKERKFRVLTDKELRQEVLEQSEPWVMERTFLLQVIRNALESLYNFLGAIPPLLTNEQVEYPIKTVDPQKFPAGIRNEIEEWVNAGKQLYNSLGKCVKIFKRSPRQPTNADIEAIRKNDISNLLQAFIEATKKLDEAYKELPQDEQGKMRNPADLLLHPSGLERLQQLINSLLGGSPTTETFAKSLLLHLLQGVRERQQPPIEVKHTL